MKTQKAFAIVLTTMIIFVLLSIHVSAGFGISVPYDIKGNPGETNREIVQIQNKIAPTSDITIEIIVKKGEEYVSFPEGKIIEIKSNETKNILLDLIIPNKAKSGQNLEVSLLFKQISGNSQSQGTVGMSMSVSEDFQIKVIGEKGNNSVLIISSILSIIIIILTTILIKTLMRQKNKQ